MKTLFIFLQLILFCFVTFAQPYHLIVSPNGTTKVATSIYTALSEANDGDIIYAPPGLFYVDTLVINKSVHIIGAGYNYLAAGTEMVTYWHGSPSIESGADRGSLQGIFLDGHIYFGKKLPSPVNNYTLFRCFVTGHIWAGPDYENTNSISNLTIKECYIKTIALGGATNTLITNCILLSLGDYNIFHFIKNTKIKNSILIMKVPFLLSDCNNLIFENCIFVTNGIATYWRPSSIKFINNIFCINLADVPKDGVITFEGNISIPLSDIFENFDGQNIDFSKTDFHLKSEVKNKIQGTDGTEVGIYGTNEPFKEYGIPFNPLIKKAKIQTISRPNAKLKIEFEVEAQER